MADLRAIGEIMQEQYKKSFNHPDQPLPAYPEDEDVKKGYSHSTE